MKITTVLNGHLLIRPRAAADVAGIVIPDSVDKEKATIGEVVVGNEVKTNGLTKQYGNETVKIEKGEVVLFNAFAPRKITHDGVDCLLVNGEDIYAIIEE